MAAVASSPRRDGPRRMRVLSVLSSSNQMYSGIGRNIFETVRRLTDRIDYEFAIDDATPRNTDLVVRFGAELGLPVHVGRGRSEPPALDEGNADLPDLLRRRRWDLVECVCFANAATNAAVLHDVGPVPLVFTPHDQPFWSVPMTPEQEALLADVRLRTLRRADLVLCDSTAEREALQALVPDRNNCVYLPLGCDFRLYRPGPIRDRREQLLFVGDLAEPRKRFDRVLAIFRRLIRVRPNLRLVVIGNRSGEVGQTLPEDVRHAVELRGYVGDEALRRTYAESLGLFLLSDYEAFGIPILEALASGTPVFLTDMPVTRSLFDRFHGAYFCPGDDADATFDRIVCVFGLGPKDLEAVADEYPCLRGTFSWDVVADHKWEYLASAWSRYHGFAPAA